MIRRAREDGNRHGGAVSYLTQEMATILSEVERDTNDPSLSKNIFFSPTAITHIRRLIDMGGTIVTDTTLVESGIHPDLLGNHGASVACFIDDPQVISLATQRRTTRAEIAVDYGLSLSGPKLMVVGSAPAALNRMVRRRQHEPMSDVCVLAASTGFASVVQLKERVIDSDLASIVVRGKKGGVAVTISIINAILREISKSAMRDPSFSF